MSTPCQHCQYVLKHQLQFRKAEVNTAVQTCERHICRLLLQGIAEGQARQTPRTSAGAGSGAKSSLLGPLCPVSQHALSTSCISLQVCPTSTHPRTSSASTLHLMITYNNFMYVLPGFVLEKPFRDPKAVLLHEAIHVPRLRKAQLISHCKLAYMQLLDGLSCVGMGIARSRSHPDR